MHPSVKEQNLQGIIYDRGKLMGKTSFKTLKYLSILRRSQKGEGGGLNFGETFFKEDMLTQQTD